MSFYSNLLERALLPGYHGLLGRKQSEYRAFVEKSQWWPEERLLDFQWAETTKLLKHAFEHVPFYRDKYKAAGIHFDDIRTREDFARLPALTREDIQLRRSELCARNISGRLIEHATGGSSGVPTRFFITRDSFEWRCAVSERAYSWTGCRLGEPTLYLWGAPIGKPNARSAAKMNIFRALRRELMFSTFSQSEQLWDSIWRRAVSWRPKLLVGYVSSLEQFCEYLIQTGRTIPSLRAAIAAAEPVYTSTREIVEKATGVRLFNTYGSREFMSIGAECEHHDGLHVHSENLFVETEAGSTTEASPVLITDLHNYGMPFIRYRIGDVAILQGGKCACRRGLPRIRSIEGRVLDALRTRDGRIVPGEFIPHLMKDIPEVREFQARQETIDRILLNVVLSGELSERSQALLKFEIGRIFGDSTSVVIQPVDAIPKLASGKRRVTIGLGA